MDVHGPNSASEQATSPPAASPIASLADVIFVLGPPGSGKTTLCKRVAKELDYYHLSVGDYARELCNSRETGTSKACGDITFSELQAQFMGDDLVPAEVITAVVADKIVREREAGHDKFLVDGFARQPGAVQLFERQVTKPATVILFSCSRNTAEERFIQRARGNDDRQVFAQRFDEYEANIDAILAFYGDLVKTLDTSGEMKEAYQRLLELFTKA